jgi:hypothetical protein
MTGKIGSQFLVKRGIKEMIAQDMGEIYCSDFPTRHKDL